MSKLYGIVPKSLTCIIINEVHLDLPYGVCVWCAELRTTVGEVACKSRGTVAKLNNGLLSVTCCSEISRPCSYTSIMLPSTYI